jgi:ribonuclease D
MQLTRLKPSSTKEIRDVDEIHPGALNRYQDQLLQLIGEAQLQKFDLAMVEQLGNAQKRQVNSMRKLVRARAEELGVDPALLASKRELEKLIRAVTSNRAVPERFLGWRKQVITEELLEQVA